MRTRLVMLGALLIPAIAFAQPAPDPDAPPPPPQDPQAPQPPAPITNTQSPSVIVNPPPPPPPAEPQQTVVLAPASEPQYEEVYDSYNAPIFTTGALVFGASYGTSVIVAASSDKDNDRGNRRLFVPVLGPWLALSDRGSCDITQSKCDGETTAKVLLVADGVFQAAGIIGMIDGLLQPSSHRRIVTRTAKVDTRVHVTPTAANGPGVLVFGHF